MSSPADGAGAVTDASRVVFHPLSMRNDGDAWVIGRMDTGDFAVMPPTAHRAIALLSGGCTIGEVAGLLRQETGQEFALADFAIPLDGLGFLSAIDGRPRAGPSPVRPSLPWLRARQLRWLLHPAVPWLVLGIIVAAAAVLATHPVLMPNTTTWYGTGTRES